MTANVRLKIMALVFSLFLCSAIQRLPATAYDDCKAVHFQILSGEPDNQSDKPLADSGNILRAARLAAG